MRMTTAQLDLHIPWSLKNVVYNKIFVTKFFKTLLNKITPSFLIKWSLKYRISSTY